MPDDHASVATARPAPCCCTQRSCVIPPLAAAGDSGAADAEVDAAPTPTFGCPRLRFHDIEVCFYPLCARTPRGVLDLTFTELQFLVLLLLADGEAVDRQSICLRLWGEDTRTARRKADRHSSAVRDELLRISAVSLETLRGSGWRLRAPVRNGSGPAHSDAQPGLSPADQANSRARLGESYENVGCHGSRRARPSGADI